MPTFNQTIVRVGYVDGRKLEGSIDQWSQLPSEGVDWVEVGINSFTRTSGNSIYWVYPEDASWVMGAAPAGYGKLPPEIVIAADGTQTARTIEFMPDLHLEEVKLGWWWPEEKRRPIDG